MTVQTLQTSLHEKAKADPSYRFYSLWDKVHREDVLDEAWRRCRANGGAPGVDGQSFDDIDSLGVKRWLGDLREELRSKQYAPRPLRLPDFMELAAVVHLMKGNTEKDAHDAATAAVGKKTHLDFLAGIAGDFNAKADPEYMSFGSDAANKAFERTPTRRASRRTR